MAPIMSSFFVTCYFGGAVYDTQVPSWGWDVLQYNKCNGPNLLLVT